MTKKANVTGLPVKDSVHMFALVVKTVTFFSPNNFSNLGSFLKQLLNNLITANMHKMQMLIKKNGR